MSEALDRIERDDVGAAVYAELRKRLGEMGPFETEAKKTSLHLTRGRAFVGVHPRRGGILLNIVTDVPLDTTRLHKQEQVSARRWHNEVLLQSVDDIDDEVLEWLAAAYDLVSGEQP